MASKEDTVAHLQAELEALKSKSRSSASSSVSSKADSVTRLQAELEELRAKSRSAASSSVTSSKTDTVARLQAELEAMKSRSSAASSSSTSSASASAKSDTVARLEAELEALRMKSSAPAPADSKSDTVARLQAELEALKSKSRSSSSSSSASSKDDTIARLQAELEAMRSKSRSSSSSKSDSVAQLEAELEALRSRSSSATSSSKMSSVSLLEAELDALRAKSGTPSRSSKSESVIRLEAELEALKHKPVSAERSSAKADSSLARLEAELEALKKASATAKPSATSSSLKELERKRAELSAKVAGVDEAEVEKRIAEKRNMLTTKAKGIDICFLVDCTGSMQPWIDEVREQITQVVEEAERTLEQQGIVRVAFCGYRDLMDSDRYIVQDFTPKEDIAAFYRVLKGTRADGGGGDGPEDVVGGLRNLLTLNWSSSTRLVIHIADYPCHGLQYHNIRSDYYPAGDPSGVTPESLLIEMIKKRIHYTFIQIYNHTKQMTDMFNKVYSNCKYNFTVFDLGTDPEELLPAVLDSVRSSLSADHLALF